MKNRPGTEVLEAAQAFGGAEPSMTPESHEWQRLAAHIDGAFVVMVETTHGRYRRRVWLTLAAAERAAAKARDAGHNAVVALCELRPLHRVLGAAPDIDDLLDGGDGR